MASCRSLCTAKSLLERIGPQQRKFSNAPALLAAWNKDWKPGPYPKTPEERAAAAKKYGMLLRDYEPYPDDGMGWGDYPKLPLAGDYRKSNAYAWDFPENKRDYGELIHIDQDLYYESRVDPHAPDFIPHWAGISFLIALVTTSIIACYYLNKYPSGPPVLAKQYPYSELWVPGGKGLSRYRPVPSKHYTFEPAE